MTLPRRLLPLCSLVLATLLAGCGGGGGGAAPGSGAGGGGAGAAGAPAATTGSASTSDPGGGASGGGEPGTSGGIKTIDALNAAIERDHGSADWFGDVTAITEETLLGAPVLVVHTTLSVTDPDYETVNRKRNDLATALDAYEQTIAPNVAILDAEFQLAPAGARGLDSVPMSEAFALPERPGSAKEVRAWLDAVYGRGGLVTLGPDEAWLDSLEEVRYEDPGWGTGKVLWLATSLPTYRCLDAQLLQKALLTTGSPLLESWYIEAKDGTGAAGATPGAKDTPVGQDGFLYLR